MEIEVGAPIRCAKYRAQIKTEAGWQDGYLITIEGRYMVLFDNGDVYSGTELPLMLVEV